MFTVGPGTPEWLLLRLRRNSPPALTRPCCPSAHRYRRRVDGKISIEYKKRPPHLSGVSACPRYHPACRTRRFCRSEPVTQAKRRSLPAPCTGPFGGAAREPVGTVSRSLRTLSAASSALLQRRWKRTIRFSVKAFGYRNYMIILYSALRFVNRFLQVLAQHLSAGSVMFFVIRS